MCKSNANDDAYPSYQKPNDETRYIHIETDHPLSINKSIEKRLSMTSSLKDIF